MSSWSIEAIIALVTLLATCLPVLALLLRKCTQHRQVLVPEADVELGSVRHHNGHVVAPTELGTSKNRTRSMTL
ncbi:hypothetical protein AA0113_g1083 [Alternaria arborescens]|uniref:Uncharacterized protein n=1 Tax=Alternaria arborescens TaxID=156630 RepID=A0A4Q4SNM7_9PLEO|nr:hypothetical protein AA0113_g1083 [Alternaria arborescens]